MLNCLHSWYESDASNFWSLKELFEGHFESLHARPYARRIHLKLDKTLDFWWKVDHELRTITITITTMNQVRHQLVLIIHENQ